ncbi:hypothetical protein QOT17_004183 [Balamuthia mandrillaris]
MAQRQDHVEAVVDPFASPEEQEQQRMRARRLAERLSVREELALQQREKRLRWGRHPLWMALKRTVVFVFVAFVTSTFWQFFAERSGVEEVSPGFWLAKAAQLSESLFDTLGRLYIRLVDLIYHLRHLRDFLYRAWDALRELLLRLIPINELWAAASKVCFFPLPRCGFLPCLLLLRSSSPFIFFNFLFAPLTMVSFAGGAANCRYSGLSLAFLCRVRARGPGLAQPQQ